MSVRKFGETEFPQSQAINFRVEEFVMLCEALSISSQRNRFFVACAYLHRRRCLLFAFSSSRYRLRRNAFAYRGI